MWSNLALADPELAAFGAGRIAGGGVSYLATLRRDGTPRVHPVTPIIGDGRLFVFMEPTSPKGHDLRRNSAYALHCSVSDNSGGSGEFYARGHAALVDDAEARALAVKSALYTPQERYILFELSVEGAASVSYEAGTPQHRRWGRP
jgi:hypothetical protein